MPQKLDAGSRVNARDTAALQRVNLDLDPTGTQGYCGGPSLSGNGSRLVFSTLGSRANESSGLVQTYAFNRGTNAFTLLSKSYVGGVASAGTGYDSRVARSGSRAVFHDAAPDIVVGDDNGSIDVFVVDVP